MPFYSEAIKGDSRDVWSKFNTDKNKYNQNSYFSSGSSNYISENDSKKEDITTIHDSDENIEDKYYGEKKSIYNNDYKYYHGTNFGPSNNNTNSSSSNDSILWFIGGAAILLYFNTFKNISRYR